MLALSAAGYDVREVQANRTAEVAGAPKPTPRMRRPSPARLSPTHSYPPAGKHRDPAPAWQTVTALRDWRRSLVLQRVRLLTEAEAVLVSLPVTVRATLPATNRVLPQINALAPGNGLEWTFPPSRSAIARC